LLARDEGAKDCGKLPGLLREDILVNLVNQPGSNGGKRDFRSRTAYPAPKPSANVTTKAINKFHIR
jgi:hypothetical protein